MEENGLACDPNWRHRPDTHRNIDLPQVERMLAEVHGKFPGHPYGLSHGKNLSIIDRSDRPFIS